MGFRFRRSVKIAPGVRWNFGKNSTSLSIGPRGAKVTLGTKGTRVTTGIPGTGLSFTQSAGRGARPSIVTGASSNPPNRSTVRRIYRLRHLLTAVALFAAIPLFNQVQAAGPQLAIISGFVAFIFLIVFLVGAPISDEPRPVVAQEQLVHVVTPEQRPLRIPGIGSLGRLDAFEKDLIVAARSGGVEELSAALDYARHDLTEDESQGADQILRDHVLGLLSLLPTISAGAEPPVTGTDEDGPYWLHLQCMLDKPGDNNDEDGALTIRPEQIEFLGRLRSEWRWANVVHVAFERETLYIQMKGRKTPVTLDVSREFGGARRATLIIDWRVRRDRRQARANASNTGNTGNT